MSKFCPFCGEKLVDEAKFCKNCGKDVSSYTNNGSNFRNSGTYAPPVRENSHTLATVLGFICAIFIPLFGVIFAVYLLTRNDSPKAKKYGTVMLIISILVWIISFITMLFMY